MNSGLELVERVRSHARRAPSQIAYLEVAGGRSISYAQLVERIESFCDDVPANVVILRSANRIDFPVQFLACLMRSKTVFPISIELAEIEVSNLYERTSQLSADGSMLLASSGTTGEPKIVRRDAKSLDRSHASAQSNFANDRKMDVARA